MKRSIFAGAFTGILAQLVAGRMKKVGYFGSVDGRAERENIGIGT